MGKFISNMIETDKLKDASDLLNAFYETMKDRGVMVPKDKKLGVRTMAEGREGYVRLISKIAELNNDSLSKLDDQAELAAALDYDAALETTRQSLMRALEFVEETQWGNSADIMVMADRYNASLQIAREGNRTLDTAMAEIDEWNKRYGSNGNTSDDDTDDPNKPKKSDDSSTDSNTDDTEPSK